jgi:hypothetical protein
MIGNLASSAMIPLLLASMCLGAELSGTAQRDAIHRLQKLGATLRYGDAGDTDVSDQGAESIARIPTLRSVQLWGLISVTRACGLLPACQLLRPWACRKEWAMPA